MQCPRKKCKGTLKVTNSYRAGAGQRTARRECDSCTYACVTYTGIDSSGLSARALAKKKEARS